jgi:hypothetical protein
VNVVALIEDAETGLLHLGCELPHAHSGRRDKVAGAVLKVERTGCAADPAIIGRGASAGSHPNAGDKAGDGGLCLLRGTE